MYRITERKLLHTGSSYVRSYSRVSTRSAISPFLWFQLEQQFYGYHKASLDDTFHHFSSPSPTVQLNKNQFSDAKPYWLMIATLLVVFWQFSEAEAIENITIDMISKEIKEGNIDFVKQYITRENYKEYKDNMGRTALLIAARYGQLEIIEWLLHQGIASLVERDTKGDTSLLLTSRNGHTAAVKLLLEKGANINEKNQTETTPLIAASIHGEEKTVQLLLQKGAFINEKNIDGTTALAAASAEGHTRIVELLLQKDASIINQEDKDGDTPLLIAAMNGHTGTAALLLEKGAIISAKNKKGFTPLLAAAANGEKEMVRFLLDKKANISEKDLQGLTPLMYTCAQEHHEVITLLLEHPLEINDKNKDGITALMIASLNQPKEVVEKLISYPNIDIHCKDNQGWTALHYAVYGKGDTLYNYLREKGADENVKDVKGISPRELFNDSNLKQENEQRLLIKKRNFAQEERDIRKGIQVLRRQLAAEKDTNTKLKSESSDLEKKISQQEENLNTLKENVAKIQQRERDKKKQDDNSAVENFSRILSEKLAVEFHTAQAIWHGTVANVPDSFDKLLEFSQIASAGASDVATRVAANLAIYKLKAMNEDARVAKFAYIQVFENRSIGDITYRVAKMIGKRFKEQIWELSAQGVDDFAQYFCDKLIYQLQQDYNRKISKFESNFIKYAPYASQIMGFLDGSARQKRLYLEYRMDSHALFREEDDNFSFLIRYFFNVMIDPKIGGTVILEKRGGNNKELNTDSVYRWDARQLLSDIGIFIDLRYLEPLRIKMVKMNNGFVLFTKEQKEVLGENDAILIQINSQSKTEYCVAYKRNGDAATVHYKYLDATSQLQQNKFHFEDITTDIYGCKLRKVSPQPINSELSQYIVKLIYFAQNSEQETSHYFILKDSQEHIEPRLQRSNKDKIKYGYAFGDKDDLRKPIHQNCSYRWFRNKRLYSYQCEEKLIRDLRPYSPDS